MTIDSLTAMAASWTSLATSDTIGTPTSDAAWWPGPATVPNSCDIESQQHILQQFTHVPMDEQTLADQAAQQGWFDPINGTDFADLGALPNAYGIPTTEEDGSLDQLESQLDQGHKVIVAVDCGALDSGQPDGQADHAVVVDGIDVSDPNNPQMIISDPYTGDAEDEHSLLQFLQAWDASDDLMVSTDEAPSVSLPGLDPTTQDASFWTWNDTTPSLGAIDLHQVLADPSALHQTIM